MNPDFMIDYEEQGAAVNIGPGEKITARLRTIP
jgi:hypothetical protein